jgi:hypothetical protein
MIIEMCRGPLKNLLRYAVKAKDTTKEVWKRTWGLGNDASAKFEERKKK